MTSRPERTLIDAIRTTGVAPDRDWSPRVSAAILSLGDNVFTWLRDFIVGGMPRFQPIAAVDLELVAHAIGDLFNETGVEIDVVGWPFDRPSSPWGRLSGREYRAIVRDVILSQVRWDAGGAMVGFADELEARVGPNLHPRLTLEARQFIWETMEGWKKNVLPVAVFQLGNSWGRGVVASIVWTLQCFCEAAIVGDNELTRQLTRIVRFFPGGIPFARHVDHPRCWLIVGE